MYISHDLQHVQSLLQGLTGEVGLQERQLVLLFCHVLHLAVGFPVVQCHSGQVVEGLV